MPTLNWLTRDEDFKAAVNAEYRLLVEDEGLSYGDPDTGNLIVQGDNLEALKSLLPFYAGQVKCIYIDPPYNTGTALEHYDDNLEHSIWLSILYPRLELLKQFLREDGFLCCTIDDSESHYLKILLDEIMGRKNYIATFYLQVRYTNKTLAEDNDYQKVIEQCFIYAKDDKKAKPNKQKEEYKVEKFEWKIEELSKGKEEILGGKKTVIFTQDQYKIIKIEPSFTGLKETWATGSLIKQKASSGEFMHLHISPRKEID